MMKNKEKIKDLFKFLPKSKHKAGEGLENGEYPFYTSSSVVNKYYDSYDFEADKLIFATGGCASVHYADTKFAVSTDNFILEPKEKVNAKYVYYYLKNNLQIIQDGFHGAGLQHLSKDYLNEIYIPMVDENSQSKIVSILDKVDEIRKKKKQANEKLDEFLKSTFLNMFGDPVTNNKHWDVGTIRDIITEAKYGTSSKAGTGGKYPILRMGNLTYKGDIVLDDLKYIDLKSEELNKYLLKKGDILFNRTNSKELVGKTAMYKYERPMAFAGYLIRVRTNEKATPEFLSAYMNTDYMKNYLRAKCKNIVGMANINAQEFQNFKIYIPPIEEQNKFAEIVEKVEKQKQTNERVITQMDNLFNSLSQKAFKREFSIDDVDLLTKQTALHAKIIDKCRTNPTFGAVKMEKLFNICDMALEFNLAPNGYHRKAAGPYIPEMRYAVEEELTNNHWFKIINPKNGKKVEFKKGEKYFDYKPIYTRIFGDKNEEIERVLTYFYDKDTDYCEAFSTLYMCWNDFLIEGKNPNKSEIIDEFRNHWSQQKQRFARVELLNILSDMENLHLKPHGQGLHTIDSDYNINNNQTKLAFT